ncbi:hypothetical protein [Caulobacter sp. NIBR1757]|uniref:hypothetical protein n=1 Tax=Caulobacter sp. NIBR1757 TaxID=3016000 RepID=UPI0022F05265|nr:hypothetical protein [Caulobacter sp. NIBR1757]WGM39718.1 hypothetical protein AMEJIAPC_02644 [Caulobacter sp. NIBR1757]
MYVWTGPWAQVQDPTPLLRQLAGDFAHRIARVWPAPHGTFLIADAARRHLVCLVLAGADGIPPELEMLLDGPLKRAIRRGLPGAPEGLERALGRTGEIAWPAGAYSVLLTALADPMQAKVLRHAEVITPVLVEGLAEVPVALLRASNGQLRPNAVQAALLTEAYDLIARRDGAKAANAAANRWGRSKTLQGMFERVGQDIIAELPAPPFPGTATLRPLASKAAMRDAARRYRNCLASNRLVWAAAGDHAFYEWLGGPGVIVELNRDPLFGWRLNEARIHQNGTVPVADRPALIEALKAMGVHVGRCHWSFAGDLDRAWHSDFQADAPDPELNELFGY